MKTKKTSLFPYHAPRVNKNQEKEFNAENGENADFAGYAEKKGGN